MAANLPTDSARRQPPHAAGHQGAQATAGPVGANTGAMLGVRIGGCSCMTTSMGEVAIIAVAATASVRMYPAWHDAQTYR